MIVVAIIAIVASIAIPNLVSARMSANETAAISTMRNLVAAQAQVRTAGVIDGDGDGVGEYAYFGELAGTHTVRVFTGGGQAISPTVKLIPPVASSAFGNVTNSMITRSGYIFQIYLPNNLGIAVPEAPNGGANPVNIATEPDPNMSETTWCAYAWPVNQANTSNRVFFVNQAGDMLQCLNTVQHYQGPAKPPLPAAAFLAGGTPGLLVQPLANTTVTKVGMDGEVWTNVN